MSKKPSPAQLAVLQNLEAGRSPTQHLRSMSEFGGYKATYNSLYRNGWIDNGGFLTDAGRAALAKTKDQTVRCPECGSAEVFSTHEQAFMVNGGDHYCHMVKAHDSDAKAGCLECNWRGERHQLKETT